MREEYALHSVRIDHLSIYFNLNRIDTEPASQNCKIVTNLNQSTLENALKDKEDVEIEFEDTEQSLEQMCEDEMVLTNFVDAYKNI